MGDYAKAYLLRKGTAEEHKKFTGLLSELTFDTTNNRPVAHDGKTKGGFSLALLQDIIGLASEAWVSENFRSANEKISIDDISDELTSILSSEYDDSVLTATIEEIKAQMVTQESLGNFVTKEALEGITVSQLDASLQRKINSIIENGELRLSNIEMSYLTKDALNSVMSGFLTVTSKIGIGNLDDSIVTLLSEAQSNTSSIGVLSASLERLQQEVNDSEIGDFTQLTSKINEIESKIEKNALVYDDTEIRNNLESLSNIVNTANAAIEILNKEVKDNVYDDTPIKDQINDIYAKLNDLDLGDYDDSALRLSINNLSKENETMAANINTLNNQYKNLVTKISEIQSKGYDDSELKKSLEDLTSNVADILNELDGYNSKISTLDFNVSDITARLNSISSDYINFSASVESAVNEVSNLVKVINGLQSTVDNMQLEITYLKDVVKQLQDTTSQLVEAVNNGSDSNIEQPEYPSEPVIPEEPDNSGEDNNGGDTEVPDNNDNTVTEPEIPSSPTDGLDAVGIWSNKYGETAKTVYEGLVTNFRGGFLALSKFEGCPITDAQTLEDMFYDGDKVELWCLGPTGSTVSVNPSYVPTDEEGDTEFTESVNVGKYFYNAGWDRDTSRWSIEPGRTVDYTIKLVIYS